VPRASIENRRSWTVLLLLRVRRLDRVSKARRADGGLLFKTPWSCVCVCVWAPAPCLASGIWSFLRLTVLACGHGNVAGMGILWNCMLTLDRNQIWQEPRAKRRPNHQSNPDAAACSADSV
jgi:hypothetical protein